MSASDDWEFFFEIFAGAAAFRFLTFPLVVADKIMRELERTRQKYALGIHKGTGQGERPS